MKKRFIYGLLFLSSYFGTNAQPVFTSKNPDIQFLERKLTTSFYSPTQQNWWYTSLTFDSVRQNFRYRIVTTENPGKMTGRRYVDRFFEVKDINPHSIHYDSMSTAFGDPIMGIRLIAETVKHKRTVMKFINTKPSTGQTFVHFYLPIGNEDTLRYVADSVLHAFKQLATIGIELLPLSTSKMEILMEVLTGDFECSDSSRLFISRAKNYELNFERIVDRRLQNKGRLVIDTDGFKVTPDSDTTFYTFRWSDRLESNSLALESKQNVIAQLHLINRLTFLLFLENKEMRCIASRSGKRP